MKFSDSKSPQDFVEVTAATMESESGIDLFCEQPAEETSTFVWLDAERAKAFALHILEILKAEETKSTRVPEPKTES